MIDIRGSCCGGYYRDCYRDCYGDYCGAYCGAYCGDYWWVKVLFIDLAYYASYLGTVGVKGDISALKWDGAYADKAYINKAYTGGT